MNDLVTEVRRWVEGRPDNPVPLVYEDEDKGRLWNIHCSHITFLMIYIYCPKRSFGQGNVFTPVCHSFCSQGGCLPGGGYLARHPPAGTPGRHPPAGTPPGRHPPWQTPPWQAPPHRHPPGRHPPGRHPLAENPPWQAPPQQATPP